MEYIDMNVMPSEVVRAFGVLRDEDLKDIPSLPLNLAMSFKIKFYQDAKIIFLGHEVYDPIVDYYVRACHVFHSREPDLEDLIKRDVEWAKKKPCMIHGYLFLPGEWLMLKSFMILSYPDHWGRLELSEIGLVVSK